MQHWRNTKLTGVDEDSVHIELSTEGAEDEATGGSKHQRRKEDSWNKYQL